MALKACLDGKARAFRSDCLSHRLVERFRRKSVVLWREIERPRTRIVRKRVLDIQFVAGFTDEGHGVSAGPKCPIDGQPGQVLGIIRLRLDALRSAYELNMEIRRSCECQECS